ncbi:MAG: XRE family transcriptional regulator, partial [Oscillospiraceae bacterium]|nr:XRE family transcriptional regulator [Oscillospiraceae bacterium]
RMAEMLSVSAPFLSDVEKGRRNSLDMDRLVMLKEFLSLSEEDYQTMLNLAGRQRKTVAPDLPEYIMDRDYVSAALRTARDLDAGEAEWQRFVEELKKRKR